MVLDQILLEYHNRWVCYRQKKENFGTNLVSQSQVAEFGGQWQEALIHHAGLLQAILLLKLERIPSAPLLTTLHLISITLWMSFLWILRHKEAWKLRAGIKRLREYIPAVAHCTNFDNNEPVFKQFLAHCALVKLEGLRATWMSSQLTIKSHSSIGILTRTNSAREECVVSSRHCSKKSDDKLRNRCCSRVCHARNSPIDDREFWSPQVATLNDDFCHVVVLFRIPNQPFVCPLLLYVRASWIPTYTRVSRHRKAFVGRHTKQPSEKISSVLHFCTGCKLQINLVEVGSRLNIRWEKIHFEDGKDFSSRHLAIHVAMLPLENIWRSETKSRLLICRTQRWAKDEVKRRMCYFCFSPEYSPELAIQLLSEPGWSHSERKDGAWFWKPSPLPNKREMFPQHTRFLIATLAWNLVSRVAAPRQLFGYQPNGVRRESADLLSTDWMGTKKPPSCQCTPQLSDPILTACWSQENVGPTKGMIPFSHWRACCDSAVHRMWCPAVEAEFRDSCAARMGVHQSTHHLRPNRTSWWLHLTVQCPERQHGKRIKLVRCYRSPLTRNLAAFYMNTAVRTGASGLGFIEMDRRQN